MINEEKANIKDVQIGITPKTAIGQRKDGAIIMLAIDGKDNQHRGASLEEEQEIMYNLGCVNAINLITCDTTMYYNNEVINRPTNMITLTNTADGCSYVPEEMKLPTAVIVK
ncbi:phosphodiester glycosidase family protein [Clostridium sp. Maddingley MBC34-26]|uniref:phosphodiester glycosidase family protein n=1 Tax=Clostridium sp. Maddingley MBC34-26 TaxID=1196322 RepID=UPI0034219E78